MLMRMSMLMTIPSLHIPFRLLGSVCRRYEWSRFTQLPRRGIHIQP
jgi:hypothetical protein